MILVGTGNFGMSQRNMKQKMLYALCNKSAAFSPLTGKKCFQFLFIDDTILPATSLDALNKFILIQA